MIRAGRCLTQNFVRGYRIDRLTYGNRGREPEEALDFVETQVQVQSPLVRQLSNLINAYRRFGHLKADLDPLKLCEQNEIAELDPKIYGFEPNLLDTNLNGKDQENITAQNLVEHLEKMYCDDISVEFMHLNKAGERQWFAKTYEKIYHEEFGDEQKIETLQVMLKAKGWENFLATKFPTLKRYSGEGSQAALGFYKFLMEEAPNYGIQEFIFDGAHRGRIALQTILFEYPYVHIFRKIRGKREFPAEIFGTGDVLTHQASHFDYLTKCGREMHVSTIPNPSHLGISTPIAVAKARARAQTLGLGDYSKLEDDEGAAIVGDGILCVHHHGDGAFTGQGSTWETLSMSQIPHFRIGGSIHFIVNNQIAFTAEAKIGRSSIYCSDIAKAIDAPIIHVNGNSVEKILLAARMALEYRQRFRKDIFINMVCYRKYGHNELDDPSFTQPLMYKAIGAQKSVVDAYAEELAQQGLFSSQETEKFTKEYHEELEKLLKEVDLNQTSPRADHLQGYWKGFKQAPEAVTKWDTGVETDLLKFVGAKSVEIPENFSLHPHLQKTHVEGRLKRLKDGNSIDWSTAEAMAFGSLLLNGYHVRICGQDVGRATFSHRHAMLVDQNDDGVFIPLNNLCPEQENFLEIVNSPLTENAILAFEYGMAIENPKRLVIWEAQFGDFYNGAQIPIDQLIVSGEGKWLCQNGLTLLLPHGIDGAGPDHSSSHVERFLQLTDSRESQNPPDGDNINMWVVNPTTSAQYFHLLRRQMIPPYRKPMVIIAPKILLRHPSAASKISEFASGTHFKTILVDSPKDFKKITRVIFTSGKHAVTLNAQLKERNVENTAIVRLEAICPFPLEELSDALANFPNAKEYVWSQEEPRNAGCWSFVSPRFRNGLGISLRYNGRPELAWMATAIAELHQKEIENLLNDLFG